MRGACAGECGGRVKRRKMASHLGINSEFILFALTEIQRLKRELVTVNVASVESREQSLVMDVDNEASSKLPAESETPSAELEVSSNGSDGDPLTVIEPSTGDFSAPHETVSQVVNKDDINATNVTLRKAGLVLTVAVSDVSTNGHETATVATAQPDLTPSPPAKSKSYQELVMAVLKMPPHRETGANAVNLETSIRPLLAQGMMYTPSHVGRALEKLIEEGAVERRANECFRCVIPHKAQDSTSSASPLVDNVAMNCYRTDDGTFLRRFASLADAVSSLRIVKMSVEAIRELIASHAALAVVNVKRERQDTSHTVVATVAAGGSVVNLLSSHNSASKTSTIDLNVAEESTLTTAINAVASTPSASVFNNPLTNVVSLYDSLGHCFADVNALAAVSETSIVPCQSANEQVICSGATSIAGSKNAPLPVTQKLHTTSPASDSRDVDLRVDHAMVSPSQIVPSEPLPAARHIVSDRRRAIMAGQTAPAIVPSWRGRDKPSVLGKIYSIGNSEIQADQEGRSARSVALVGSPVTVDGRATESVAISPVSASATRPPADAPAVSTYGSPPIVSPRKRKHSATADGSDVIATQPQSSFRPISAVASSEQSESPQKSTEDSRLLPSSAVSTATVVSPFESERAAENAECVSTTGSKRAVFGAESTSARVTFAAPIERRPLFGDGKLAPKFSTKPSAAVSSGGVSAGGGDAVVTSTPLLSDLLRLPVFEAAENASVATDPYVWQSSVWNAPQQKMESQ
eukprot:gene31351-38727_t